MRPVLAGLIRYESLKDGSIGMLDLKILNEALDVREENQRRMDASWRR